MNDSRHWNDTPVHVLDFEGSLATGVVEFGVATLHRGTISNVRTRLCAPNGKIPPEETRLHGISNADTSLEAPFSKESELFMDLRETGPICAHNAAFERHLLKAAWPYPRLSPDFAIPGKKIADWGPFVDTMRLFQRLFPGLPEYTLGSLIETFGLSEKLAETAAKYCPANRRRYHCALYDALGSALLLSYLENLHGFENLSLEWLIMESQPSSNEAEQTELF